MKEMDWDFNDYEREDYGNGFFIGDKFIFRDDMNNGENHKIYTIVSVQEFESELNHPLERSHGDVYVRNWNNVLMISNENELNSLIRVN